MKMNKNKSSVPNNQTSNDIELKHYKRECLLLSCALFEACLKISNDNKNEAGELMMKLIENEKPAIAEIKDCCIDSLLNQYN